MRRRQTALATGAALTWVAVLVAWETRVWRSDWSQFFPNVLAALATGATVGVVLWRLQVAAERHALVREVRQDWEVARQALVRATVGGDDFTYLKGDPATVGFASTAVEKVIAGKSVAAWQTMLDDPVLDILAAYVEQLDSTQHAATKTQTAMNTAIARLDAKIASLREIEVRDAVLQWIDLRRPSMSVEDTDLEPVAELLGDPYVNAYGLRWRAHVLTLGYLYDDLVHALGNAPEADPPASIHPGTD